MADLNGDGLDDATGYANGVKYTGAPPTGFTYNGMPVYSDGRPYAAAGGNAGSGSGTGGYGYTGTQIPLDAAQANAALANAATNAAAQQSNAAYQTGSLAQQAAATAQAAQASAQRSQEAMAQYALQAANAERQYQVDLAKYGLDVADFNWKKTKAAADMALQKNLFGVQTAQFDLSQNQFNATQRQAKEGFRQNILKMLADRRGPQDAYAYNNLLNGLDAPDPARSTEIDPFSGLDDLYKESTVQAPQWTDPVLDTSAYAGAAPSAVNLPSMPTGAASAGASAGAAGSGAQGGGAAATQIPHSTPQNNQVAGGQSAYAPTNPAQIPVAPTVASGQSPIDASGGYAGVPASQLGYLQSGQFANVVTGLSGPSTVGDYSGFEVFQNPQTQWTDPYQSIPGGTSIWLRRMAQGGDVAYGDTALPHPEVTMGREMRGKRQMMSADTVRPGEAAAVVGDKPGRKTGAEEIAVARTGPDGKPMLHVIPNDRARQIMQRVRMAHAAGGGTYGSELNNPTIKVNQYSPEVLGNLPAYQKLIGRQAARPFGGFGATISNPKLGIYDAPSQISLQRWNMLRPSEQKLMGSFYEQGLGMDLSDMLQGAASAAPEGRARVGYAAGMGPASYGRG